MTTEAQTVVRSNKMSNQEITDMFPEQVASGRPFIYYIKDTINAEMSDVYIAEARKVPQPKNLDGEVEVSEFERELKGWDDDRLIHHRNVYGNAQLVKRGLDEGTIFEEGVHIFQRDSLKYRDDKHKENPRQNNAGFILTNSEGQPIFRHTKLAKQKEDEPLDLLMDFHVSKVSIQDYRAELAPEAEEVATD